MAELPKSWGLKTKKNARGRCEVWGKDDSGKSYKVRECDTACVTEKDIAELKAADRESYANKDAGIRQFIKGLTGEKQETDTIEQIRSFDDSEWIAAAEPVVHAGMERRSSTVGYSKRYATQFERVFKEN